MVIKPGKHQKRQTKYTAGIIILKVHDRAQPFVSRHTLCMSYEIQTGISIG